MFQPGFNNGLQSAVVLESNGHVGVSILVIDHESGEAIDPQPARELESHHGFLHHWVACKQRREAGFFKAKRTRQIDQDIIFGHIPVFCIERALKIREII